MISFDDGGGSYGSGSGADLSPIYRTLQILNTNTESMESELSNIWNFVSTLSFTTISYSTPYIESYRTANEKYMYNITGTLPTFNNTLQFLRGNFDILTKTYNGRIFNIDYVSNIQSVNFNGCEVSMTGKDFTSLTFEKCGMVDIRCRELKHMFVSSCPEVMFSANYLLGFSNSSNTFSWITNLHLSGISDMKYNKFTSNNICCINSFRNINDNSFGNVPYLDISNARALSGNTFSSLTNIQINNNCQFAKNYLTSVLYVSLSGNFDNNTVDSMENLNITGGCNVNTFNTLWNLAAYNGGFASNSFNFVSEIYLENVWMVSNTIYGSTNTDTVFGENVIMNATAKYVNRNYIQDFKTVNINCGYSCGNLSFNSCNYVNLTGNCRYLNLLNDSYVGKYNINGNLYGASIDKAANVNIIGKSFEVNNLKNLIKLNMCGNTFKNDTISNCTKFNLEGIAATSMKLSENTYGTFNFEEGFDILFSSIKSFTASFISATSGTLTSITSCSLYGDMLGQFSFNSIETLDLRNVSYIPYATYKNITCLRLSRISSNNIIYQSDNILGVDLMVVENTWWNGTMLNIPSSAGLALHSSYVSIGGVAAMNYTH